MVPISDIVKLSRNAAGVERVVLILESDIAAMPEYNPASLYFTGYLALQEGGAAYFIYFTRSGLRVQEKQVISNDAGDYFEKSLTGSVPHVRPETRNLAMRLRNRRCTLIYKDRNGHWRIMRRMRCEVSSDTGTPGGYNGLQFSFTGKDTELSGFWQFQDTGIIPNLFSDCDGHSVETFVIGFDSEGIIGDELNDEILGF